MRKINGGIFEKFFNFLLNEEKWVTYYFLNHGFMFNCNIDFFFATTINIFIIPDMILND